MRRRTAAVVEFAGLVPIWLYLTLGVLVVGPWWFRYLLAVLGQGCGWMLPAPGAP